MSRVLPSCSFLFLALASCAGTEGVVVPTGDAGPAREAVPAPAASGSGNAVSPAAVAEPAPPATLATTQEDAGLAIWKDPAFQRSFAESYLAETEIEPRVTPAERDDLLEVMKLVSAEQLDRAAELLRGLRGESASAVVDFTFANLCFQRERLEEAAAAYRAAVQKYPKFRRAWRNLGLIQVRQREFAEAVRALTRVIELGGSDAITFGLLGFAHANEANHLCAESAYRMATLLDPLTLDWKMGLARSLFQQQRFGEASALCATLIVAQAERADLWLLQANAYLGLNQPLKAAENLELVDRMGQSTPDTLAMLGDIYVNQELYEPALAAYLRAMERTPQGSIERYLRAAKVLTARGATQETRRLVDRIATLRGERLDAGERKELLKLKARVALADGAGDEEAKVLQEIVALDPLDGDALILLGQHSARGGDLERAVFYYERAASLEAFEADAKVRHAQLLVRQGRYAEALPLLRRAQVVKPRDHIQEYLEQVERVAKTR